MKPKVSEKETGLLGTRLRSNPQSPGAPPRTLPLVERPRGSDRASRYHTQSSTRTRGAVSGETVITENRKRLQTRSAREMFATVLPVPEDRFRYWAPPASGERSAPGLGGGGEGTVLRGLWSEGAGPLPRNRVPVSPQPRATWKEGPWGWVFPRDPSKAQLRGQSSVRGRAGGEDAQESVAQRQAGARPPAPRFTCWPLERRPGDRETPPLAPLPGSPYGMVSAQALGSSSWMSRTLSMDFWAWDRACLAKLESWEALNQLISPPQPPGSGSTKREGQGTGRRSGARGRVHGEPRLLLHSASRVSGKPWPRRSPPSPRCYPRRFPHSWDNRSNCAGASCFHVHNRQLREPGVPPIDGRTEERWRHFRGLRLAYSYRRTRNASYWNWFQAYHEISSPRDKLWG